MSNQEILEALSEIECYLYYRADGSDDQQGVNPADIRKAHSLVRGALEVWHKATGCTLDHTKDNQ